MITHHSAGGVYMREQTLQAGYAVDKHSHAYDHFSILARGSAMVEVDGDLMHVAAPAVLEIKAGQKHRIQALTDIVWFCIHNETIADPDMIKGD